MANPTFSNKQLCVEWNKAVKANGTRRDVVLALMTEMNVVDNAENYRKTYNNVTQRVKQLSAGDAPITFPPLREGKKGSRRATAEIKELQDILNAKEEDTPPENKAETQTEQQQQEGMTDMQLAS